VIDMLVGDPLKVLEVIEPTRFTKFRKCHDV
jgi:hypothetical protein